MQNFQHLSFPNNRFAKIILFIAITVTYFFLCNLRSFATFNQSPPPIWVASGFAVGISVLYGKWLSISIFIGATLAVLTNENNLPQAISIGFGNAIEAYVGTSLITGMVKRNYFKNYNELFSVTFGAIVAALAGATLSSGIQFLIGTVTPSLLFKYWINWWTANSIKILVTLPLVLEICNTAKQKMILTPTKILTGVIFSALCFLCIYSVLVMDLSSAFLWTLGPVFVLLGICLGKIYSRILLILVSLFAAVLTSMGYGPFGAGDFNLNLIYIESIIASFSCAVLFVELLQPAYKVKSRYLIGIGTGWALLFIVIYSMSYYERKNTRLDFEKITNSLVESLKSISNKYEILLSGAAGLYVAKHDLTQEDWGNYVVNLNKNELLKSINGLGLIIEVSKEELKDFEVKNGRIKTINPVALNEFKNHFIVKFVEPKLLYNGVIGTDFATEERRRKGAEKSKESKKTIATQPISLYTEDGATEGFLIYHPIIGRNNEFLGLTYAPVLSHIFYGNIFENTSHLLKVKIFLKEGNEEVYNNHPAGNNLNKERYHQKKNFHLFGIDYRFEFTPTSTFYARYSGISTLVSLLLIILTLFISVSFLDQMTLGQRAEALSLKMNHELEVSRTQLINSSKMAALGGMASELAHEINNPLTIIQGKIKVISFMMHDLNINNPILHRELNKIKLTTDRIEKIIKGLRNFSRSSSEDPFEPASLKKIISETVELCGEKLKSEGIELKLHNIPGLNILCRPSQISQVMINLINNSTDAIVSNNKKWIEIKVDVNDDKLVIYFTDSGNGIPLEVADKIMEPFYTTKAVSKGTGLGLSITKNIIESHNGNFWLDINHHNTRFIIELPLDPHQRRKYYQMNQMS